MDTNQRLYELLQSAGWSEYRLSKNSGLSESTIANIFRRNTVPSIPTLQAICDAFGITLSQFFAENEMIEMTREQAELFSCWKTLTKEQKQAFLHLMRTL